MPWNSFPTRFFTFFGAISHQPRKNVEAYKCYFTDNYLDNKLPYRKLSVGVRRTSFWDCLTLERFGNNLKNFCVIYHDLLCYFIPIVPYSSLNDLQNDDRLRYGKFGENYYFSFRRLFNSRDPLKRSWEFFRSTNHSWIIHFLELKKANLVL